LPRCFAWRSRRFYRARAADLPPLSHQIVGEKIDYTIAKGDNWIRLGARFGVGAAVIASDNGVAPGSRITAGKTLRIDNRHIVPIQIADGIEINLPQRMLFYFADGVLKSAYPAAVGRVAPQWRTPTGKFRIIEMREAPTWRVPDSIREEMLANGKEPISDVPPGPDNPLGNFWIGISLPSLGIHGTNSPMGIYGFHTHGCIRLAPANAAALFTSVDEGERGMIIYEPILLARTAGGRIFLEVNRDAYKQGIAGIGYVHKLADADHLSDLIDWSRAGEVAGRDDGIARDVTADPAVETGR
jgi:L,D-transpeptidase ErfK/SrfK